MLEAYYELMSLFIEEYGDLGAKIYEEKTKAFADYILRVYNHVTQAQMARFRLEGQDLVDKLQELDRRRKDSHDRAIDACNFFNRHCEKYGVEKFCETDTGNRYKVADFVGRFVYRVYLEGIKAADVKSMDDIVALLESDRKLVKELEKPKK